MTAHDAELRAFVLGYGSVMFSDEVLAEFPARLAIAGTDSVDDDDKVCRSNSCLAPPTPARR